MMESGWEEEPMVKERKNGQMVKHIKECLGLVSLGEQV